MKMEEIIEQLEDIADDHQYHNGFDKIYDRLQALIGALKGTSTEKENSHENR